MIRAKLILQELSHHAPFTAFGAVTGTIMIFFFYNLPSEIAYNTFYVLHPLHVLLSALTTAAMYRLHSREPKLLTTILIGYLGSVGIATLSDSVIPYLGEFLLNLPNTGIHLGFIEEWWLVNPLAFLGIAIAIYRAKTKIPHAGHVLLSTWASLFHVIMALGGIINWILVIIITLFLFFAVWLPCCLSDIVFPLLFVKEDN
jgi:hypothetical protein